MTTHSETDSSPSAQRRILVEANITREASAAAVTHVVEECVRQNVVVRMVEATVLALRGAEITQRPAPGVSVGDAGSAILDGHEVEIVGSTLAAAEGCELVLVLGGDGTFLRASEYARAANVPVLGVNLGHVGFLAESEVDSLPAVVRQIVDRDYHVVNRMTVEATVYLGSELIGTNWALNEVSIEKIERQGVLEATVEVDGRPVSDYGCDGVMVSTPTGSTAYAFSAGGPIVWPELDAMMVVPNNAHALFARPLVVSPSSHVAVEIGTKSQRCLASFDGRRSLSVPEGARVEVAAGSRDVKWVRLDDEPFTDRLVSKFQLPVTGWRGRTDTPRPPGL